MASLLSISSDISLSSAIDDASLSGSSHIDPYGARSFPFVETGGGRFVNFAFGLLADGFSNTVSSSLPDCCIFAASSIIFGADDVGVGVANASLTVLWRLRCWIGGGLISPIALSAIMASNLLTSAAILVYTSALKISASSKLNPAAAMVTGTVTGVVFPFVGGVSWSVSNYAFKVILSFSNVSTLLISSVWRLAISSIS
jgi:hypothetical protein